MYKCPKCGGVLAPHSAELWKCGTCGKVFRMKRSQPGAQTADASKQDDAAKQSKDEELAALYPVPEVIFDAFNG